MTAKLPLGKGYTVKNGTLFKTTNSDNIYWVDEGKDRQIENSDVLHGCFDGPIEPGEITDLGPIIGTNSLIANVGGKLYFVDRYNGGLWVTRFIPNMDIFNALHFKGGRNVADWPAWSFDGYGVGPRFTAP